MFRDSTSIAASFTQFKQRFDFFPVPPDLVHLLGESSSVYGEKNHVSMVTSTHFCTANTPFWMQRKLCLMARKNTLRGSKQLVNWLKQKPFNKKTH
jgi:hypothetical protein